MTCKAAAAVVGFTNDTSPACGMWEQQMTARQIRPKGQPTGSMSIWHPLKAPNVENISESCAVLNSSGILLTKRVELGSVISQNQYDHYKFGARKIKAAGSVLNAPKFVRLACSAADSERSGKPLV